MNTEYSVEKDTFRRLYIALYDAGIVYLSMSLKPHVADSIFPF